MSKSKTKLHEYINILESASDGSLFLPKDERFEDKSLLLVLYSMRDDGFVFFPSAEIGTDFVQLNTNEPRLIVLTPKGAQAIIEWNSFIKENTFLYRTFNSMSRLIWVLIGALAATLPKLIECAKIT